MRSRWWIVGVAAIASLAVSLPLIVKGTPDVESYMMSIFSTVAFSRNLMAGVDPFFVPTYAFGIPLPTSSWLIKFAFAIPAAVMRADVLYAAVWLTGEFVFAYGFLSLSMKLTGHRGMSVLLQLTAVLSFSNLGTTYVDDWPEHFAGWALFPACLWSIVETLTAGTTRSRFKAAALCAFVLSIFTGSSHQNDIVTFYSGMGLVLALVAARRPRGALAVAGAAIVALCSAADVLVPTVAGMVGGGANPLVTPIAFVADDLTWQSYRSFLEPLPALADAGWRGLTVSSYHRVPFFGLVALALAGIGAARSFTSRASIGEMDNDIGRMIGGGFVVFTVLTLLPSAVMLHLPRMWMYRDGQTVFGLLCAGMALGWRPNPLPRLRWPLIAVHVLQIVLVAAPIALNVLRQDGDRLFAYARREHLLFNALRAAGAGPESRVVLAGEIDDMIRGGLTAAGITATTDFALDGIGIVNAWYRGGATPALGRSTIAERYGAYETVISWKENIRHLDPSGFEVLGITHVVAFERDVTKLGLADRLTPAGAVDVPGLPRIVVLRNHRAWSRAVMLNGNERDTAARPGCPTATIWCRDFDALSRRLQTRLDVVGRGSSIETTLPPGHAAGRLLVTVTAGSKAVAVVDGRRRDVELMMDTFPTIAVRPEDRTVAVSVARTDRMFSSITGFVLVVATFIAAVAPDWRRSPAVEHAGGRQ